LNFDWLETILIGAAMGLAINYVLYAGLFSGLGLALAKQLVLIKKLAIASGLSLLLIGLIDVHYGFPGILLLCLGGLIGSVVGDLQIFAETGGRGL
jgi:hypothetical protein